MGLLAPLGLLGLIGIPILIIIYIIKPKYHEKKISSTFVWKLSLRYRKRKIPLQWLQKSLLFFVQVFIIGLTAILLARPLMKVSAKDVERVVILDVSASMNATENGVSRLDKAIDKLLELANDVDEENKLTIIVADATPEYLTKRDESPSHIKYLLENVKPTFEECNFDDALILANAIIEENPTAQVFYYTDCNYEKQGYVEVVNFANNEWNVGILDFTPVFEDGYYKFNVKIGNYGKTSDLKLTLKIDDGTKIEEKTFKFAKNEVKEFVWEPADLVTYENAKLEIYVKNSSDKYELVKDSLNADNEFYVNNIEGKTYNVQLVGFSNAFLNPALKSIGSNVNVYVPEDSTLIKNSGYDLYVYDGYLPEVLPNDGAIWVLNPPKTHAQLGFSVGTANTGEFRMQATNDISDAKTIIMEHITSGTIEATKYMEITNYDGFNVLMSCNNDPILLAGRKGNAKVVVLAIDLHYSNLPINLNMAILVNNVFDYCVNDTIENSLYNIGDEVILNTKPLTTELKVDGKTYVTSTTFVDKVKFIVNEPGIYKVEHTLGNKKEVENFYVRISENESNFMYTRDMLAVDQYINIETGVKGNPVVDSFYMEEASKYFAGALLLLVIIEWGLQYREQY